MKKTIITAAALAALLALRAGAAEERFCYQGRLAKPDGSAFDTSVAMPMSFRLYDVPAGGQALWGRDMAVRMESDGSFYVELSDTDGSAVAGTVHSTLKAALASGTEFWIGLMPSGYSEMLPRQPLATVPRALAASAARHIDTVKAEKVVAGSIAMDAATEVGSLTVPGAFSQGSGATTLSVAAGTARAVEATEETKVTHAIKNIRTTTFAEHPAPAAATTDTFAVLRDPEGLARGWYSLVFPVGAALPSLRDDSSLSVTFGPAN